LNFTIQAGNWKTKVTNFTRINGLNNQDTTMLRNTKEKCLRKNESTAKKKKKMPFCPIAIPRQPLFFKSQKTPLEQTSSAFILLNS